MSRLLGVSRNAYYRYCQRQRERLPNAEHEAMIEAVKKVAQSSDKSYGSRRMKHALNALGYPVGRRKARSLMREAGVKARYRRKFKATTNSDHKQPVFDNVLARDFSAAEPDQAYVGDITYIWTREGWLYLAVFIDLFSRRIVGWSMGVADDHQAGNRRLEHGRLAAATKARFSRPFGSRFSICQQRLSAVTKR